MKISKDQEKEFRKALLSAFSTRSSLKRMLSDSLETSVYKDIYNNLPSEPSPPEDVVFELFELAESKNVIEDLIIGAYRANSTDAELINFLNENLKKLVSSDENLIPIELCCQLLLILQQLQLPNLDFMGELCIQVLPPYSDDNYFQDIKDIKNSHLVLIFRIFLLFRLLIIKYPRQRDGIPSILIFAEKLSQKITDDTISQELIDWINQVKQINKINIPINSPIVQTNTTLEAYLIITFAPASELGKFCLNAYLDLPKNPIIPIDLPEQQSQKGVIVSLKKNAHEQAPQAISDFIIKCENVLSFKQRELGCRTYSLTIEFFLPLGYLHEDIENFKILILEEWLPMGAFYKIVVRSYDRVKHIALWNELQGCWVRIRQLLAETQNQQENHIECLLNIREEDLSSQLQNKIGLKLPGSLPASEKIRQRLFNEIVRKGIPVAIWTRCSDISEVDIVTELNQLLNFNSLINPESLLNEIKQKRDDIKYKCDPHKLLGYHLGIMYESDRWGVEIPLPEAIPLSE